jgi:3,4-dihydroxy-2-butanone 4-phosphate synthase
MTMPKTSKIAANANAPFALSSTEELVAALRSGQPIVVADDENRENEGDLIVPAQAITEELMALMIRECSGIVCLAMAEEMVRRLDLPMMPRRNMAENQAPFTVSIEAKTGVRTGVSAADRVKTVLDAINPDTGPQDISTPGHIYPLKAHPDGVLGRAGHTEAAVDLMRLAGLSPAAVICEVMNPDGTMARLPDLMDFCARHDFKLGTVADLIRYRTAKGV